MPDDVRLRRAGVMLWMGALALILLAPAHSHAQATGGGPVISVGGSPPPGMRAPSQSYYLVLAEFYAGDFTSALNDFLAEGRGSIKFGLNRWVDVICYHTMAGECYYQLGDHAKALDQYTSALQMFQAHSDWMIRVQFDPTITLAQANAVKAVPWGQSQRNFRIGKFRDDTLYSYGQINQASTIQTGGVVQNPMMFPVNVQEIVRCTGLAMRRRGELLGPMAQHDTLVNSMVEVMTRRRAQVGHWSEAWMDLQLGMALAAAGKDTQAKTALERSLLVSGEFDHPLTAMALVELGRIALDANEFQPALNYFEEATYAAVNFNDIGSLEEAFRRGFTAHMISNRPGIFPPLAAGAEWARRQELKNLQVLLMTFGAENGLALGETQVATRLLADARTAAGRRQFLKAKTGALLDYVTAIAQYQSGKRADGDAALASAMGFQQRGGSLWLFQIALTDRLLASASTISPRVAMDVYANLLREPTAGDWLRQPFETLSVMVTPHSPSYDHWFDSAISRREYERALEIADRARRHRFYNSLELGGRLLNLRWLLASPLDSLPQQAVLDRQELLVRYPQYEEFATQAAAIQDELRAVPLVPADKDEAKTQEDRFKQLADISAKQELLLRQMSLRRHASMLVFPPIRETKEVQAALQEGDGVLAFFSTSKETHGFLLARDKFAYWPLAAPADVQKQLVDLLHKLGNWDQNKTIQSADLKAEDWKKPAGVLLDLLTKASKADIPYEFKRLAIVPDNILWYLPFEALQFSRDGQYHALLRQVQMHYAPTVSLAVPDGRPRRQPGEMAVVLGRLFPQEEEQTVESAYEDFARAVSNTVPLRGRQAIPSSLYAGLFQRLTVLADIPSSSNPTRPYDWAPMVLDDRAGSNKLGDWIALPWVGPELVILPGFHTPAEDGLKQKTAGSELFLSVCGLMASGSRTVLISRWRPGGQSTYDLMREFAQELPHTTAADAWQRAVLILSEMELDPTLEPRITKADAAEPVRGDHPFFWSGFLVADTGSRPTSDDDPAAPPAEAAQAAPPAAATIQAPAAAPAPTVAAPSVAP